MNAKRIPFKYVLNMRDLGGIPTRDGNVTKFNSIIRSSVISKLTDEEKKYLLDNNITTSIDLRKKHEIEREPSALKDKRFNYFNIPIEIVMEKEEALVSEGYLKSLEDYDSVKKIFEIIANAEGGAIFNCSAGKDRTGIVAALILMLIDVSKEDIIADYIVTQIYLKDAIEQLKEKLKNFPFYFGKSEPIYMERFLKLFKEKYDNIDNYLEIVGISQETKDKIKRKLLNK